MRSCHSTITPPLVQACAQRRLQQHLRLPDYSRACTAPALWTLLLYAAAPITSLAAACAALPRAPPAPPAHAPLLAPLPACPELQRRLNRALQGDLPRALRRRPQPLAIDLTLVPYHGQPQRDPGEVYRSQPKAGT